MSNRSEESAEMRSKFSQIELDRQFKQFVLSGLHSLLGSVTGLEFIPYNPEDGNTFAYLFADSLDIRKSCGSSGDKLSEKFCMDAPPIWKPNQLIHIESAIGEVKKDKISLKWWNTPKKELVLPFEIAEIRKVVARRVLHNASFQAEVAKAFYLYLRTKVIMYPDEGEIPRLSIATCWILIYTYVDKILSEMDDSEFQLIKSGLLHTINHYLQSERGWASFWDLYVFQLLASSGFSLPPPIEEAEKLLYSLVDGTRPKLLKGLTIRNWRKKAPKYAKYLFMSENSF